VKKKTKNKPKTKVKSRILGQIAYEIKAAGRTGAANVGHSKTNHLSTVFIKN